MEGICGETKDRLGCHKKIFNSSGRKMESFASSKECVNRHREVNGINSCGRRNPEHGISCNNVKNERLTDIVSEQ